MSAALPRVADVVQVPSKHYGVREDYSRNPSFAWALCRTPLVKLGELEYTPS
jgi:hypothetical protein